MLPVSQHPPSKTATTTTTTTAAAIQKKNNDAAAARARAYALSSSSSSDPHYSTYQTPPLRPVAQPGGGAARKTKSTARNSSTTTPTNSMNPPPSARRKISPLIEEEDEDYARFVESLGTDDPMLMASSLHNLTWKEDEEEEFQLEDMEEDDDDEDLDLDMLMLVGVDEAGEEQAPPLSSPSLAGEHSALDHDFYSELEAELGSLLEEDLEAAVSTLVGNASSTTTPATATAPSGSPSALKKPPTTPTSKATPTTTTTAAASPTTPLRDATRNASNVVTTDQVQQLQSLLKGHYQLLLQNSVLAIRAARKTYGEDSAQRFFSGETPEDLAEILDGAVGMLQDLDQNRKDAIRSYIQKQSEGSARLTRSAFSSLQQTTNAHTIFDVPGLSALKSTFSAIDHSGKRGPVDVLEPTMHADACRMLLEYAGAEIDPNHLPGTKDVAELLCDAKEVFGADFSPPSSPDQVVQLRRNRNQFTAAEDNLVLRGVNLYGEKQWILIADRYLPDRSVNIISQRYSKICLLLYKAHGVKIDQDGSLLTPPRFEKVDQLDEEAIAKLKKAAPPAILNVHRWSIEEDVTLLKAVPLLGHMWAELSTRLIPHRDRGHLRKRYQVLERRVKATVSRCKKNEVPSASKAKASPASSRSVTTKATKQTKKSKAAPKAVAKKEAPKAPASSSILRGPMPPHLLCPTNKGAQKKKHPGAAAQKNHPAAAQKTHPGVAQKNHPGARMAAARQLPVRRPHPRDGSNSFRSDQYGQQQSHHGPSDVDSSRAGFEKIINETNDDWSQLSRMKKMMENDTESMVASAIVNNLATGVREPRPEKHPQMEMDNKPSSGLSMLHNRDAGPSTPQKKHNGSIMASVMERTRRDAQDGGTPEAENDRTIGGAPSSMPLTPSRPPPPPQRYPSSSFGTPIGVSPGPGLRGLGSVFSPGANKNGQSPGMKSCFSPAALNSMMFTSGAPSTDDYELYPFELTEASRQALEDNTASAKTASQPHTPSNNNADLFHDPTHLKATDLEAISALNSLSNSPAKFLKKRPVEETDNGNEKSSASQSLFAAVVGGVEKKESKRKKRRTM